MSDPVAHELLRELLNETRELRRHLAAQTEHIAALESLVLHSVTDPVRTRFHAERHRKVAARRQWTSKLSHPQRQLAGLLEARGLRFVGCMPTPETTAPVRLIAERLAEDFDLLEPLLKAVVHAYGAKAGISFPLAGCSPDQRQAFAEFAQQLEDYGMLRTMNPGADSLHLEPLFGELWENYFSGYWLEQAVLNQLSAFGTAWGAKRIVANGKFEDHRGRHYEFDLILPAAGGDLLMIDAKTGKLDAAIPAIRRNAAAAGIPADHHLVVLPTAEKAKIRMWEAALGDCARAVSSRDLTEILEAYLPQA